MSAAPLSDFRLLEADIRRQPEFLAGQLQYLRQAAHQVCSGLPLPPRIYLVSSGDGLSASLAVRCTWERVLGVPVEAVPSMTFSRYAVRSAAAGALVIVISQSGKVVRAVEALAAARQHGLPVTVFTSSPDSPVARMAGGAIFNLGFTRLGFVPGTSAYTYTLAALYEFAAALSPSAALAQELHTQIDALPQALAQAVESAWQPVGEFAQSLQKQHVIYTLGSGPAYGTAHYTSRKLFEICQASAVLLETEEYAHDAYYAMGLHTPAVLFAPPDAGFHRCVEVAGYIAQIGCPLLVISASEQRAAFTGPAVYFAGLPSSSMGETTIAYAVAAQVLACLAGPRLGGSFYASANPQRYQSGDAQIYESARMDAQNAQEE
jgi:fructoselysine-6-P-deglycase FrlB-like protein